MYHCLLMLTRGGIGIGGREQGGLFLKSKQLLCLSSIKDKNGHLCQPPATKVLTSCRLLRLQPRAILERNNWEDVKNIKDYPCLFVHRASEKRRRWINSRVEKISSCHFKTFPAGKTRHFNNWITAVAN